MWTHRLLWLAPLVLLWGKTLFGQAPDTARVTLTVGPTDDVWTTDTIWVTGLEMFAVIACPGQLDCSSPEARITEADGRTHQILDSIIVADHGVRDGVRADTVTVYFSRALVAVGKRFVTLDSLLVTSAEGAGRRSVSIPAFIPTSTTTITTAAPTSQARQAERRPLPELLVTDCDALLMSTVATQRASLIADDTARFVVNPLGIVAARPPENIDEADVVEVTVVGTQQLLPQLVVRRSSAFRTPGGLSVLGAEVEIPVDASALQRQALGLEPECDARVYRLADFAPGRGEVEIAVRADGGEQSLGTFDFGVNRLYHGAISLGVMWTTLGDPEFGLVFDGQDSVITQTQDPPGADKTEANGGRFLWGLFYHPFVPKRDVEKERTRATCALGVGLNDISQNFFLGGSLDWASNVYLVLGAHVGRVTDIDERSGLKLGDPFDGTSDEIPTVRKWKVGFFVGGSLDVRAAVQLLRAALGGAAKP